MEILIKQSETKVTIGYKYDKIMVIKREKIEDCVNWEEIFDYQSRKDGANYTLLKEWLIKNYKMPLIKTDK